LPARNAITDPGIAFEDLPDIDLVLLSHNHYDHLDLVTLARLRLAHNPLVITPLGNDAIIKNHTPGMRMSDRRLGPCCQIRSGDISLRALPSLVGARHE
jgi:L-ascorbate metabolism protein UlaG (beta-lactamase superfamily)